MGGWRGHHTHHAHHGPSEPTAPPEPPEGADFAHEVGGPDHGFGPSTNFSFGPGRSFVVPPVGDPRQWLGWEHRGQRARRGNVRVAALVLLAEQPMNGYQIIQEIKQRSAGMWTPSSGSVYPVLQQLEDEGLIQAGEHDGRRAFSLTEAGRRYVEEHADELRAPWESVAEGVAHGAIGLREIYGRTFAAFMQVWHTGTDEQRERAAHVLDQARRALYRILADDDPMRDTDVDSAGSNQM